MPNPAVLHPSLARMLKKASRPDWFRWKPMPPPPAEFIRRFPEMRDYFTRLAELWSENESAVRRALESIPDPLETTSTTLSDEEIRQVQEIAGDMIAAIPPPTIAESDGSGLTEEQIQEMINLATATYIHNQTVAASEWTVIHNLNRFPSVMVVDSADRWFIPEVQYTNSNALIIRHSGSFSGKAYLN